MSPSATTPATLRSDASSRAPPPTSDAVPQPPSTDIVSGYRFDTFRPRVMSRHTPCYALVTKGTEEHQWGFLRWQYVLIKK